jgi:hypothetical protein
MFILVNQKFPPINALPAGACVGIEAKVLAGLTAVHIFAAAGATLHNNEVYG